MKYSTRVVIYIRVSTKEQTNGHSIEEQTERLKKYADAMGWTIVKIYVDPGYSGSNIKRPALKMLMSDIESSAIDKVVVYKLDRLSRSQKDTLYLIEDVFLKNNVDFVSMTENFDTSTPFGRAMIGLLSIFAQLEREQIKERMEMGREARAKKGYYHGSANPPIGYDYIDGELIINDYEAMLVKEVYNLYCSGVTTGKIAKLLNSKGYNHRYGEWNRSTIRSMLLNKHYIGQVRYQKDNWFPGIHKPIIDEDTFEKASQIFEETRKRYDTSTYNFNRNSTLLGGLLKCARCGHSYGKTNSSKRKDGTYINYYTCNCKSQKVKLKKYNGMKCDNKTYRMKELDEMIIKEIGKLKADPEYLRFSMENKPADPTTDKTEIIKKEIDNLNDQISRFMDLYSIKKISLQEVDAKISPLSERVEKLRAELQVIIIENTPEESNEEKLLEIVDGFNDILKRGEFEEMRLAVTTLINYIEIDGDDQIIHWNFK